MQKKEEFRSTFQPEETILPEGTFGGKAHTMKGPVDTPLLCPVLIGRTDDLAVCRSLLTQTASGKGALVLVSGEAGIGKSRLVAEVKTEGFSHDFQLVQGSCFPTDLAIPYAPLLDLLRSHFSSHSSALTTSEARLAAQAFLPLLPDLGRMFAGGPPPIHTPLARPRTGEAPLL